MSDELRKLEADLKKDLVDSNRALRDRIREAITRYLLTEAGRLTNTRPQEAAQVNDLLLLHYKVALLQKAVENPRSTSPREFKELIQTMPSRGDSAKTNPLDILDQLNIPDDEKATLLGITMEAAKSLARKELEE